VQQSDGGVGEFTHKITTAPGVLNRLADLTAGQLKDINVVVYHGWDTTRRHLSSIDLASQSLTVHGNRWMPWNPWKADGLLHLENFRAALDAPGEWFLDRDGTLFYKAMPGQDPQKITVFAPRLEKLVMFRSRPESQQFVEHMRSSDCPSRTANG
jgi:hypothetical protein